MKLAFSTLGNPDWSFDKTLNEAQKLGFDAIEIRGVEGRMLANEITQFLPQKQSETKLKLAAHNMKICGFGTSVSFHDFERYDAMIEEGKNVKVILEVHGDFNTIENIMEVTNEVKDRNEFGILWDVAHSDRSYRNNYIEFYSLIKPFIYHVHIKDHNRNNGNFKLCLVGDGDIPLREIMKVLCDDGYTGYFSLEWEKKWHPQLEEPEIAYPAFVEYMRSLFTQSFSE